MPLVSMIFMGSSRKFANYKFFTHVIQNELAGNQHLCQIPTPI